MVSSSESLAGIKLEQILFGAIAVWLIHETAGHWFGRGAARAAAVLAILTGLFTFYEVLILQAALDPLPTALGLYLLTVALAQDCRADSPTEGHSCGPEGPRLRVRAGRT